MKINITYKPEEAAYRVSVPNWDGGEVVTVDEYNRILSALKEIAHHLYDRQDLSRVRDMAATVIHAAESMEG